jgi:membrane-associated HD superfamily phosphohydrolase
MVLLVPIEYLKFRVDFNMINKKRVIFLVALVIVILLLQTLMYKTGVWYDQTVGRFFTYVSIISVAILLLSPLKDIKDKRESVSFISYMKGMVVIVIMLSKAIFVLCKEIVATIFYVVAPKLFKDKENDQDIFEKD